jgi:hypothetical protein
MKILQYIILASICFLISCALRTVGQLFNKQVFREEITMKTKTMAAISVAAFCLMMMTAGAAWCENLALLVPGSGTVTDSGTGLVWLQNADCFGQRSIEQAKMIAANLKSGSCGLRDGSTAGQWRLPTEDELKSRYHNKQGFRNVQADFYWSSSLLHFLSSTFVRAVSMLDGSAGNMNTAYNYYVWPVRSGQ